MKIKANKIIYPPYTKPVSFEVCEGIPAVITGSDNASMSILLSLLAGLIKPLSGTVTAAGKNITQSSYNIGYIYNPAHFTDMCSSSLYPPDTSYRYNYVIINHKLDTYGYISYSSPDTADNKSINFIINSMLSFPDIILIDEPFDGNKPAYTKDYIYSLTNLVALHGKICILSTAHADTEFLKHCKIIHLNKYMK